MITKQQTIEYLICTIGNYTSSNLAEHLDDASHDVITDYLRNEHHTAHGLCHRRHQRPPKERAQLLPARELGFPHPLTFACTPCK
jgi:hypothetical protein